MIVEPFTDDKVKDNLNPLGRVFYAASTVICVPESLAHNIPALGEKAGECRISVLVKGAAITFNR